MPTRSSTKECSSPLPRCPVLFQQGFPITLVEAAMSPVLQSPSSMKEGSASSKFNFRRLPATAGTVWETPDCHVPKKPRKESDDVRVLSHARNDAVGGGCGGRGGRVMFVKCNAVTGGVITSQKIIYTAAKTSGGGAVAEGDNWSSEEDELT